METPETQKVETAEGGTSIEPAVASAKPTAPSNHAVPAQPEGAYRVVLTLNHPERRIDQVLLVELRKRKDNLALANITRTEFKELFTKRKIRIKGQPARASSSLARGTTYIDILSGRRDQ